MIKNCFFCQQDKDCKWVIPAKKLEPLPPAMKPYRDNAFVICDECNRLDPIELATILLDFAKTDTLISN